MRGSSLKVCSALPAELDSFLKETVSYRIEAILEARCPYGEDFEDLERLILDLMGKEKERERKAEALLERAISRTAVEQQTIYEEAFLDGLRLGYWAYGGVCYAFYAALITSEEYKAILDELGLVLPGTVL